MVHPAPHQQVIVLTGASRGLGAALGHQLLAPHRHLICVARHSNPGLEAAARAAGCKLDYHLADLGSPAAAAELATRLCAALPRDALRYVLINNAATVEPIGPADQLAPEAIVAALNLNLAAVMVLTGAFLSATADLHADKRVLNISSGAGRRPHWGWSVYCSSKAGLDMYTRCVNAEQATRAHGARLVSLAPGMVDTDMQAQIRDSTPGQLNDVEYFREVKANKKLSDPQVTARNIVAYLDYANFGQTEIDDIRQHWNAS